MTWTWGNKWRLNLQLITWRNQSWIFSGRTDDESETPILWLHDAKNWLTGKDPDAGKDWRQEEKGMTEDEMVGRHHWLDGHEFAQALGVGNGQGSLACCSPWGHKESDITEWLNWTVYWEELQRNLTKGMETAGYCSPHLSSEKVSTQDGRWVVSHRFYLGEQRFVDMLIQGNF